MQISSTITELGGSFIASRLLLKTDGRIGCLPPFLRSVQNYYSANILSVNCFVDFPYEKQREKKSLMMILAK